MKTMSPHVVEAVLAILNANDDEPRSDVLRVRMKPAHKQALAKVSASQGMPAATWAHNVLVAKMQAHVSHPPAGRTGATRRPVARPITTRRHL